MGQRGEPSKIYNYLPMVGGKTTAKLGIAAYEDSDAGNQLLVTERENSSAKSWLPNFCKFGTSFAPPAPFDIDDASVYTGQKAFGYKASEVIDGEDEPGQVGGYYEADQNL